MVFDYEDWVIQDCLATWVLVEAAVKIRNHQTNDLSTAQVPSFRHS